MKKLSEQIRTMRKSKQLTQAQMAEILGVQYQSISKWENGSTMPDSAMLPKIADCLECSTDDLFGRSPGCNRRNIPTDEMQFLLQSYSQAYDPEAGPWNLSLENKYLEFKLTEFFEMHFVVTETTNICNIGIGAGEWDRYLSYKLKGGSLTSIDSLPICCRQLESRLRCENNPNQVYVLCMDAMNLPDETQYDIVTMIGSTAKESNSAIALFQKACSLVKPNGSLYYQSLDENEDSNQIIKSAFANNMQLSTFLEDHAYGFRCYYYKFYKRPRS